MVLKGFGGFEGFLEGVGGFWGSASSATGTASLGIFKK